MKSRWVAALLLLFIASDASARTTDPTESKTHSLVGGLTEQGENTCVGDKVTWVNLHFKVDFTSLAVKDKALAAKLRKRLGTPVVFKGSVVPSHDRLPAGQRSPGPARRLDSPRPSRFQPGKKLNFFHRKCIFTICEVL